MFLVSDLSAIPYLRWGSIEGKVGLLQRWGGQEGWESLWVCVESGAGGSDG